ncbi:MAG TPA: tetratricopeptide repeat protein [Candidatus Binatia bacterium]|nr:tetratricopeptide repeat protein [Candidatus Binatia bacterium]
MKRIARISLPVGLSICLSLISGCETIVYWDNLPPLATPRVVRIPGDNEEIIRAVKITQRLVDAAPFPAATVFVMTLTHFRTNLYRALPVFDLRARAFRCPVKGEKIEPTRPPSSGCIVLPEADLDRLSDDGLAALIAHELGHIEKGHKSWQGSAEPVLIQWEADEAAANRLYLAGYCAGAALRKAGKELASVYGLRGSHPWQRYPVDCNPKEPKDATVEDSAFVFYKRGLGYYEKKDNDGAIDAYNQAIKLNPNYAVAFNDRGNAYLNKKDYERAIQDYSDAIRLAPGYAVAFFNRALAHQSKNDHERAIQDYDRAIELRPNYSAAFHNRGNAYRAKQDYDRAIREYDEAIRLNPNYALAFNNRARAYHAKGQYDRALGDHESAARLEPKAADHFAIARLFFYLGRFAQSADATLQALKTSPQNRYVILWRYIAQARSGGMQTAMEELVINTATLKGQRWPAPVIDFYLGKIDEKALYAAAESSDPKRRSEQICEANFYAAQAKIFHDAPIDAISALRLAENCPPNSVAAHGARAELKRFDHRQTPPASP